MAVNFTNINDLLRITHCHVGSPLVSAHRLGNFRMLWRLLILFALNPEICLGIARSGLFWLGKGRSGCCKHGDELQGYIKCNEFPDCLKNFSFSSTSLLHELVNSYSVLGIANFTQTYGR